VKNTDQIKITGHNSTIVVPDVIYDFGGLLKDLRDNHGFSQAVVAKKIGWSISKVHGVETNKRSLPPSDVLKDWLMALGCGVKVTNKLLIAAKNLKNKHFITLNNKERSNPDIVRLITVYKQEALTEYDRCLLALIARTELRKEIS
jgi:transcriptional regulator with XRE-family HTH domain